MNKDIEKLKRKANALPTTPGIYLMKDQHGTVVYVGKANSLKNRVTSYFRKNQQHANKTLRMVHNITDFDTVSVDTELDALLLECQMIQQLHPMYNRQMNHFANYCYLDLSGHQFQCQETRTETSVGPFRRPKQLPLLFQLLSETYQLDTINPIAKARLEKQLPAARLRTDSEKWRDIRCFFTGEDTDFFRLCQQRLTYLTEELLFEQAQILNQQLTIANHFYQEIKRINQFWQAPDVIIQVPMCMDNAKDLYAIKYYHIQFGQVQETKICSPTETFNPRISTDHSSRRPLTKSDLDPVCILINYHHRLGIRMD